MDIIGSFLKNDGKYTFIKQDADASKKEFYLVAENSGLIMVKITKEINAFDEYFEEMFVNFSQYDYFRSSFFFLDKEIGSVPKIVGFDNHNGIILMENVGTTRLKEYVEVNNDLSYIYQAIDWLIKFQQTKPNDMVSNRSYGYCAMKKEIEQFVFYGLGHISDTDLKIFWKEINRILQLLNDSTICLNHRDYQLRNLMVHKDSLYVIDTQDICLGPYFADLGALLFNGDVIIGINECQMFAKYYLDKVKINDTFETFYQKLLLYGFIRLLKSSGTHLKYYLRDGRKLSFELVEKNRIVLKMLEPHLDTKQLYQILDRYFHY